MERLGIYIHIPFCLSKCNYCDFVSFSNYNDKMEKYTEVLCKEIKNTKIKGKATSIFIGGGTPTAIPKELLTTVVLAIKEKDCIKDIEFTVEVNPETVDYEYLKTLYGLGVNRLSFGLQSHDDDILKKIGRVHNFAKFKEVYNLSREIGFNNINVDLMYNLPSQKEIDWVNTLNEVISLNPEHISAYSLIIEENTEFHKQLSKGEIKMPDEDLYVKFNEICVEILQDNGYKRYEVSNYAKSGYQCEHNKIYWKLSDYYGFGLNAHSKVGNTRYSNTSDFDVYLKGDLGREFESLSIEEVEEEFIFLGLRMCEGISKIDYESRFKSLFDNKYKEKYSNFIDEGLVIDTKERLVVTRKGMHVLNYIIESILL
ncbi:MAG: radical SAM family heme chaperone HemW [Lachnospirales bacterium]